jgi:deoxyribonuclease-4
MKAACGLELGGLTVLIENTAGAEFSLGGTFEQVAELLERLRGHVPAGACIDTCHTHVAGYDIVSEEGRELTLRHLGKTVGFKNVRVWHCNDAKAERGSRLDRHEHIGRGKLGLGVFQAILNDRRLKHGAFIAETPVDEAGDDWRNVEALRGLAPQKAKAKKGLQGRSPALTRCGCGLTFVAGGCHTISSKEVPHPRHRWIPRFQ